MSCRSCDINLIEDLKRIRREEKLSWKQRTVSLLIIILFSIRKKCRPSTLTFKFYGNWCGPNHSGPGGPIDSIDCACFKHDNCYKEKNQKKGEGK